VTIIEFENNEDGWTAPKCLSYCDLSHIYAEGLPMLYDNWNPI
jgi:probable phosphoglycerate mutase